MKVFEKQDFGIISFGRFNGKKWSEVPEGYLKYLISEECLTNDRNKEIADKELKQRNILDGQIEMF